MVPNNPIDAIIGRDARDGEPIFNEFEARAILKRLADAGFVVMPKEPTEEMLQAGSMTTGIQMLQGLIALGIAQSGRSDSVLAHAYRAMIGQSEAK